MPAFQVLLDKGYKEFPASQGLNHADQACQKTICHGKEKLFSINAYEYQARAFSNGNKTKLAITCQAEFYKKQFDEDDKREWFTVQLHHCEYWSVEYILEFFQNIYNTNKCVCDPYNN